MTTSDKPAPCVRGGRYDASSYSTGGGRKSRGAHLTLKLRLPPITIHPCRPSFMSRTSKTSLPARPRSSVQNVEVALFNLEGSIYALDNMCQHAGGPLGEGKITGDIVICPWHGYRYHIKTGQYIKNPEMSVACYPVKVEDGKISVAVAGN